MKKSVSMLLAALMLTGALAGCGSSASGTQAEDGADSGVSGAITVISREDGSGTRGAFIELTGVEEKTADGKKVDNTTADAEIANKTDVVLTSVAGNEKAIGYISLGALNDTVKAVKVDGAEATVDNVKAGAYKLSRPFNIATKGEPTGVAKDFISFILSKEGRCHRQQVHRSQRRSRVLRIRRLLRPDRSRRLLLCFSGHGEADRGLQVGQPERLHRPPDL